MSKKFTIPPIGLGTWQLSVGDATLAIQTAVECGYRLIDTAASYGNEVAIKRALRECVNRRDEIFISGKLWNTKRRYDDAITACKQSLKRLGLEYVDLYLIHWPASPAIYEGWRDVNAECWRAMEQLKRDGLAREIGVCNYLPHHLDELMKTATVMPVVNQIELHPGFKNTETLSYCREQGIVVEAWSPLGEGKLLANEILVQIAMCYNKTPAQICLRWCFQHDTVPLPKSANPEHIRRNIDVFDFELSGEDMAAIDAMPFSGGAGNNPDTISIYS